MTCSSGYTLSSFTCIASTPFPTGWPTSFPTGWPTAWLTAYPTTGGNDNDDNDNWGSSTSYPTSYPTSFPTTDKDTFDANVGSYCHPHAVVITLNLLVAAAKLMKPSGA